jgi:4-amino-4-deoxy-L-arabinose transferase-like glycosyltransferase
MPRIVWAVLLTAFLLRLWGTWYGLPYLYIIDEYHEVMRALQLGTGSFNFDRVGKGGFYFVLFFEYGIYFVLLKLAGVVASAEDFGRLFARDPSAFYWMGRATAAIIGAMTVAVAFQTARRAYSTMAGVLAAAFLTFNVLHVDLSRRIGVDVPMTLLALVALYFATEIAGSGRRRHYVLAALFAALATTTKLTGILVVLPLLLAHTYYVAGTPGGIIGWWRSRNFWTAVAVFIGVLFVTNPGIVTALDFFKLFADSSSSTGGEQPGDVSSVAATVRPNLYLFYLDVMRQSMGWLLFIVSMGSVVYAAWRRTSTDMLLLVFVLTNYAVISSTNSATMFYPRYALPIIVVLTILAGRAVSDLVTCRWRLGPVATTIIACVLLVVPGQQLLTTAQALIKPDTRTLAKTWFEANVPAGSKVLIEGQKIAPSRETVPLQDTREVISRRIAYWKDVEPRQAQFLRLKRAVYQGKGYELTFVDLSSIESLETYAHDGIEYFVIRPSRFTRGIRKVGIGSAVLVHSLQSDPRARLLKRFDGDTRTQLGPTIEIYQLQLNPGKDAGVVPQAEQPSH